jgi:ABC-type spermidine/putrescine transport system permease subunit I
MTSLVTRPRALPEAHDNSIAALARLRRVDRLRFVGLWLPAIILVSLTVVLPVGWLLGLSFVDADGSLSFENYLRLATNAVYANTLIVTFEISFVVTALCGLLGYPVAYVLLRWPKPVAAIALLCVLVPFWTSSLVRSYAWLVLLQKRGLINDVLIGTGVIQTPLQLVYNMTGAIIGMTHVMLPFLILPLLGAMRSIDPDLVRSAESLGSTPTGAFWRVFFPMSLPGLCASLVMVFILCLGFYVTPSLLGGGRVQMLAQRMETTIKLYDNWGAASALGGTLLVLALTVLAVLLRAIGVRRAFQHGE